MKYLFWLVVGLFVWWAWRRALAARAARPPSEGGTPTAPDPMGAGAHCGLHLPRAEAVAGERGDYCSTAHRNAAADRNPH